MKPRIRKIDQSQTKLTPKMRRIGFSVCDTHELGQDRPDAFVGIFGITYPVEFKTGHEEQTEGQKRWARDWQGRPVEVVRTEDDIFRLRDKAAKEAYG